MRRGEQAMARRKMQESRMPDEKHWAEVYRAKRPDEVSWYQASPEPSLAAIARHGVPADAALIDVGGGASLLVDRLLGLGFGDLTVLDIAAPALDAARARLGPLADKVDWQAVDVTRWEPRRRYDVWHDRAVFHFLTGEDRRSGYKRALADGLAPGGLLIIATFAPDGPETCSGLPVRRYDADLLRLELGEGYRLVEDWREAHSTPWGSRQAFTWCAFRAA